MMEPADNPPNPRAKSNALPWYLFLPAILLLGIPILTRGGAIPGAIGGGLAAAAFAVAARKTWPTILRVVISLLFSVVGYAALAAFVVLTGRVSLPWLGGIADSQWQQFTPPDSSFRVLLPGSPTHQTHNIPTPFGSSVLLMYSVTVGGNEYAIAYSDLPPTLVRQVSLDGYLNGVRDGMIGAYQGKLTAEKKALLGTHTGREFTFEMSKPKGKGAAQIYRIGGRLYELIVIGRGLNPESKDVRKFFDSFAVTEGSKNQPPEIAELMRIRYWAMLRRTCAILTVTAVEPRPSTAPTVAALTMLLQDERAVKTLAIRSLYRTHPRQRDRLVALLRHFLRESDESRRFAIGALAEIGPAAKAAVTDLQDLTQPSWPPEVRKAAGEALQKIQVE
jgi:hypothetical protein